MIKELFFNNKTLVIVSFLVIFFFVIDHIVLFNIPISFGKREEQVRVNTIHYSIADQESVLTQGWFENWDGGFDGNINVVEQTCKDIEYGLKTFTWNTDYYCDKLRKTNEKNHKKNY